MNPCSGSSLLLDPSYRLLKAHILETTGLGYYQDRDDLLSGHVARRLREVGAADCGDYLGRLQAVSSGRAEMDRLASALTIGETYFFRDPHQFELLREQIIPQLLRNRQDIRRLCIWSAGCASGAEPYSLSILLKRELAGLARDWDISILGTDLNRDFLAQAARAEYTEWHLRGLSPEIRRDCFRCNGKVYSLGPEFKQGVHFQYHNLAGPASLAGSNREAFQLILCRNVMIYFSPESARRLVDKLRSSLSDGGWLMVGQSEINPQIFHSFQALHRRGTTAYRKSTRAPGCSAPAQRVPVAGLQASPGSSAMPVRAKEGRVIAPPAVEKDENAARSALRKVRILADQGLYQEAALLCGRLLQVDALNPILHFYLALVLDQAGRGQEAEDSLRRALFLDRRFILAHYHLALAAQRRGNRIQAVRSLRTVLKLLSSHKAQEPVAEAEQWTVAELGRLARSQLQLLRAL